MKEKILVIDDEKAITKLLSLRLAPRGFEVMTATDGRTGLKLAYEHHPDLVILDIMMPEMDGYEICKRLREMSDVPVLMLTAKGSEEDAIHGFQIGADDYVRKPFSIIELEARIKALIRRSQGKDRDNSFYDDGNLKIDLYQNHVYLQGEVVRLTPTEFQLLRRLVEDIGRVVSHDELIKAVWGPSYEDALSCLSLYIHYLRDKLEDDPGKPRYIRTKWGQGYWFAPNGYPI